MMNCNHVIAKREVFRFRPNCKIIDGVLLEFDRTSNDRVNSQRWYWRHFLFQAEDGIRDLTVTGVQTCALPIFAGPLAGILTLVFDTSKGAAAVWLAGRFTGESAMWMTMAACAVLLGHCFPIWLKFKGGKGVATALGIFLALCPLAAVAALLPFPLCVAYWCCVSLGSVAAASAVPVLICFLWVARRASPVLVCVVGVACVLVRNFQHGGRV